MLQNQFLIEHLNIRPDINTGAPHNHAFYIHGLNYPQIGDPFPLFFLWLAKKPSSWRAGRDNPILDIDSLLSTVQISMGGPIPMDTGAYIYLQRRSLSTGLTRHQMYKDTWSETAFRA